MLKRVGESRHPCRTPAVVRNQCPMLLLLNASTLWQVLPGKYSLASTPWQVFPGEYSLASIPWRVLPGKYSLASTPWQVHLGQTKRSATTLESGRARHVVTGTWKSHLYLPLLTRHVVYLQQPRRPPGGAPRVPLAAERWIGSVEWFCRC